MSKDTLLLVDSEHFLDFLGCSRVGLDEHGKKLVHKTDSLFYDIDQVANHPVFSQFVNKYFKTWRNTQVAVHLCQLYTELDTLIEQKTPYEKIAILREYVLTKLTTHETPDIHSIVKRLKTDQACDSSLHPHPHPHPHPQTGIEIYKQNTIFKDVADMMEIEVTKKFIEKYFLNWDTGDLVTVLINLYECFSKFESLTHYEKIGLLHFILEDKQTRQMISKRINDWKSNNNLFIK